MKLKETHKTVRAVSSPANSHRANLGEHAVKAFIRKMTIDGCGFDEEDILTDLLTNLMHTAHQKARIEGWNFEDSLRKAESHFIAEIEEEREEQAPLSSKGTAFQFSDADIAKCANCDWEGKANKLLPIRNLSQRIEPSEIVPAGECPDCTSLAYLWAVCR